MIKLSLIFLLAYLSGAIPSGYWMGKAFGIDLTQEGSGSTGATNVLRLVGKWQAIVVLIVDIGKGFVPVYFAKEYILSHSPWLILPLAMVPIFAHSKSVFIGFKGGKSSATGFGVLIALNQIVALITISTWVLVVWRSGFSSLGSVVSIPLVPIWLWLFGETLPVISFGIVAFVFIVLIKHRSNITRLLNGEEFNFKN
ncbi:MAG: glycerol-3-phosphate 1-O-acyltransferase PlsY [Candidatus Melainabacteria bacterium]|nr:glycerol-3-phosphate 1-O-acyltransferase PlsY [Candidatus Melainabacteria bacterium]